MAQDEARLDLSGLHHLIGFLLAMGTVSTRRAFQQHIGTPFGLRPVEFTLLMLLQSNGMLAPKQLARALSLPPPNVTVLLDRLVGRGLVERRRSPHDGRAIQVLLTPEGVDLARRVQQISLTMEDSLLQPLTPGERAMLRELLLKLAGEAS
jgi:DNA-binding MarR family transcriptional regulator